MRKWSELMEENREAIVEKMVDAFKDAEGGMSGWFTGVEMDQDGEVWTTGTMSQGSQSQSSWEGKTFVVTSIPSWSVDVPSFEVEGMKQLTELRKEYDEIANDDDFIYTSFYEWLADEYQEQLIEAENELTDDTRDCTISNYWGVAADDLSEIIENQKEYESYKCEDAEFKSF